MQMSDEEVRVQYLGTNPPSDMPIPSLICASIIVNSIIFYLLPSAISPLNKSYIVSTIHACVSVLSVTVRYSFSGFHLKQVNRMAGGGLRGTIDELMPYSLCYSAGYFLYDTIIMFLYKSVRNRSALVHHAVIVISVLLGLYTRAGHGCHFLLLGEELSTIPLNLKTIFHGISHLHHWFSGLFIGSFLLSRLVYGSIVCAYTFRAVPTFIGMALSVHDTSSIAFILAQATLCILTRTLNIYWAFLIGRKTFSILRGGKAQKKNKKVQ